MNAINKRFKELRKACKKNQIDFGKALGISSSGVADIEGGRRKVTERHLIMLSNWEEFNVNIDWLRTGKGEMFLPMETDALETIRKEYRLTDEQFKFISNFLRLPEDEKETIFHFLSSVFEHGETIEDRIEKEVAKYRADLELEARQAEQLLVSDVQNGNLKKEA